MLRQAGKAVLSAGALYWLVTSVMRLRESRHTMTSAQRRLRLQNAPAAAPSADLFPGCFYNKQGLMIFTRTWLPSGSPRALVFLVHGAWLLPLAVCGDLVCVRARLDRGGVCV